MHVHWPKPLHGAREIATEIAVVVIAIVLSLSGEQLLEALHNRDEVRRGEAALRENFSEFVEYTAMADAEAPCVAARAAELRGLIDAAAARRSLPAVGPIPQPLPTPWRIDSWEAMVASQAAVHLPHARALLYSRIAMSSEALYRDATDEWGELQSLSGPPRAFGEAEEASARDVLARAVFDTHLVRFLADNTSARIVRTGLLDQPAMDRARAAGRRFAERGGMCSPLKVGS